MKNTCFTVVLAFSLTLLHGCQQPNSSEPAAAPAAPPPVAVSTITLQRESIPVEYEYVGQVAGSLEVEIRSRITGIIEDRHFTEGGEVEAEQLLFTLDDAQFRAEHQQALAAIERAKAEKLSAEAQLKQAQRELERVTPLANRQMLSQNQQDDAAAAVDVAQAQLAVAEAAIKQAQANLLTARINLDYTRVRAPINGVIGRALQNRGALVQAGSNSLLTTMVQLDPAYVDFGVPENEWVRIRRQLSSGALVMDGSGFKVILLDADGHPSGKSGPLGFEDYKVDNNSGNFAMRASIDNADKVLSPGQFVRVRLNGISRPQALAVPQRAVLDGPGGKYVYVASQGEHGLVAMQKPVVMGEWVDLDGERSNYWVVNSGLDVGDQVIVDGVARIFFPGMPVQVGAPDAPPPADKHAG